MGKLDLPAGVEDGPEQVGHRVALGDGVGGDERKETVAILEVAECLGVPPGDVVEPANVVPPPGLAQILSLLLGAGGVSEEWRVAGDHDLALWGTHVGPPQPKSVAHDDCGLFLNR